ncbi:MAG: bifunctional metallophosphatase/5'-nucleotidase [Myxococcota bacterium]
MRTLLVALVVFGSLVGCKKDSPPPEPEAHGAAAVGDTAQKKEVTLTFLVTGAENGYLLPSTDEKGARGGAAEVLGRWLADEKHCVGPCDAATTLALSTGDNANGQSISSYFKGQPTAEVMKLMGYAASAFGNRELDWAKEQFLANATAGGYPYLAANLRASSADGQKFGLQPYVLVPRAGLKVGVIGLAARKATRTPMPGRMDGLELLTDEAALSQAIPAARTEGADVVVLITDGCLHEMASLLEQHKDWAPAFVAGRDCGTEWPDTVGATRLVYPGSRWHEYARVQVTADLLKPPAARVQKVEATLVDVTGPSKADPKAAELIASWKKKLDEALGGTIGFTKSGLEQESAEMSAWLTTALRERFKTDVALLNRKGVRAGLPAGAITSASIWDLAPFENEVVTVKLTGEQLLAAAQNTEARFSGLRAKGEGYVDGRGAAIDPKKTYTLATTDYLYLGGDGFKLHEADKAPTQTKVSWQSALIEWTKAKKSDEKKPLEALLPK